MYARIALSQIVETEKEHEKQGERHQSHDSGVSFYSSNVSTEEQWKKTDEVLTCLMNVSI